MKFNTINVDVNNSVATVTLNRPHVRNAMNIPMMTEMTDCFNQL